MTTLEAIRGATATILSDGNPFAIIDVEDGMAPVRRITDRGPLQHGDSDIDFRLEPLTWPLGLRIYASSIEDHYTNRATLLRIFRPSTRAIAMRWTLSGGDVRQIDCHVAGRLAFGAKDRDGFTQRCVVPLRAADPTYYDPTLQAVVFGVGSGAGAYAFALAWPASFGGSTVNQTKTIPYVGTWRTYPTIIVNGPITNPVIVNATTGDKLDLTGITVSAGDAYTIDCRAGVKTVVNAAGTNKIADLSDDSDLATFSLEADDDAAGGLNDITVTGTSANATTEVYVRYYSRYIGL